MEVGPLAIIADDLTGALDAAAPFSFGARVIVATRVGALDDALARGGQVVSVSTRSREIPADQARARVAEVIARLPRDMRLFKKVDSRLKGNIAAELEPFDGPLLVIPAIPDFGRVVRAGQLVGFGVGQPIDVAAAVGRPDAVIPDTESQVDVAAALADHATDSQTVLVGARGLAQALAQSCGIQTAPKRPTWQAPICFAIGSTDPITLEQIDVLRRRVPDLAYVAAPDGVAPAPAGRALVTLVQVTPGAGAPRDQVAQAFAETAAPYLRQASTIVVSGGATAEALLDALELDVLEVAGEALPGMPISHAGGKAVVTKSGGFGDLEALAEIALRAMAGQGKVEEELGIGTG